MSATLEAREPVARYLATPPLLQHFDCIAQAPGGVARLRELILTLAAQGKLVPQDPADEPASLLLDRIRAEKAQLVRDGKIRKEKPLSLDTRCSPYKLPPSWQWVGVGDLVSQLGSGWSPACIDLPQQSPNQWAVLKTTAVQVMNYRPDQNKMLPEKLDHRPEIEVKQGDILITRAGPKNRVGICCVVENTPPRLMLSDKIVRMQLVGEYCDPRFVVLCLNAGWSFQQLERAKTGMAESQVNISQSDIRSIVLPLTNKSEQSRIVTRVDELMALCDTLEETGRLAAEQHERLTGALLDALANSATAAESAENWQHIAPHFDLLLDRTSTVDRLEQTILQLAVRGRLVPQDPADEPASALLQEIRSEKDRLIATGQLKRDKPLPPISDDEKPFDLPEGWEWVRFSFVAGIASNLVSPHKYQHMPQVAPDCIEKATGRLTQSRTVGQTGVTSPNHLFRSGQILYSKIRPSLSKAVVVDFEGLCSADMYPINSLINTSFLHRYILSQPFLAQVQAAENRVKMPKLNQEALNSFVVPVPPLPEQSRIVARVTELRALCAQLRQRIATTVQIQSRLAEALVDDLG